MLCEVFIPVLVSEIWACIKLGTVRRTDSNIPDLTELH